MRRGLAARPAGSNSTEWGRKWDLCPDHPGAQDRFVALPNEKGMFVVEVIVSNVAWSAP